MSVDINISNNDIEIASERANYTATETNQPNIEEKAEIIKQNREDIRTIIQSSLQISGYLMTVALGIVYFSYSDSGKDIIPFGAKALVVISSFFFPISIFFNIYSLRFKTSVIIETESQVIELDNTLKREIKYNNLAMVCLLLSIVALIGGMIVFVLDRAFGFSILDQTQFQCAKTAAVFTCDSICNKAGSIYLALGQLKEFLGQMITVLAKNLG